MTDILNIAEFKLESMMPDPSILIMAKRGSGKTEISREIIHHYRNIPGGVVISPVDKINPVYKYFFPDLYIHYTANEPLLRKILARQPMIIEAQTDKKKFGVDIDPSAILVMDDCLPMKKGWAKDENIMKLLLNNRQYHLTTIVTMQTPFSSITANLRLNFDYVFLLGEDSVACKEKLWDDYASIFPTFEDFVKVFDACTKDFGAMVIDNRSLSNNIMDKVFWFKSPAQRKFSFGSKIFIDLHKNFYDPEYKHRNLTSHAKTKANDENQDLIDSDYLFDYFVNEEKLNPNGEKNPDLAEISEDSETENSVTDSQLDPGSETDDTITNRSDFDSEAYDSDDENDISNQEMVQSVQLIYSDDAYQLSATITDLDNHNLVKILCDHVENLRMITNKRTNE